MVNVCKYASSMDPMGKFQDLTLFVATTVVGSTGISYLNICCHNDSKWPFDLLVGSHQQPSNGVTFFHSSKKVTSRIARKFVSQQSQGKRCLIHDTG